MFLPGYVTECIDILEAAGHACYAVGGCVRDSLLGLTPHDYDLCTAAPPEELKRLFSGFSLVTAGEKHGTVGVITPGGVVEITAFRAEGDYTDSRHPGWVRFVPDIREDLARRDFTVNAMAFSPARGFCDPFGGRADLQNRVLRCVGIPETRFREDALRILRGVRFSMGYGLTPEPATLNAMTRLAPLLDSLARERVLDELTRLLPLADVETLLAFAPVLGAAIPELKPLMGFDQHNPHHLYDIYTHTAHVTAGVPGEPALRWAALLHDIAKPAAYTLDSAGCGHFYGHARESAGMADAILRRLKAPTALRERVVLLIGWHMDPLTPEKPLLRRRLSQMGSGALWALLALQRADAAGTGTSGHADFDAVAAALRELEAEEGRLSLKELAVNGRDMMALGFSGPEIGRRLNALLSMVLDEQLPNEKQALLAAAAEL